MLVALLVFSGLISYQHAWENDQAIKARLEKLEVEVQKRSR